MVSISQVKSCASLLSKGRSGFAYSTALNSSSKATMFDAFCNSMSKSNNITRMQRAAMPQFNATEEELQTLADKIVANSGADAYATVRVKSADSAKKKIEKAFREIKKDGYDNSRARVHDLILNEGPSSLVNDGYGIRFVMRNNKTGDKNTADLLFSELQKCNKNPNSEVVVTEIEDYCGKGITPYAGASNIAKFDNLGYVTPGGRRGFVSASEKIKQNGYTRTNTSAYIKGKSGEIQIGGELTTKWGDVEHLLYDIRQGKNLDLSHFKTDEQRDLALKIADEYQKLLGNKTLNNEYSNEYLNKIWGVLREAEEKNLANPNLPSLPTGVSEVLSVENLLNLYHG